MRLIFTILLALALLGAAQSQTQVRSGEDLVQTELVSAVSSIAPGETLLLGIRFRIEPGWHIYWKNPGDSGQAPEVKWTGPPGFEFSALQFPIPKQFEQAGGIVGYGYEDEVVLITRVTVPPSAKPGDVARISADISWLVCEDVCLPGKRVLSIELPVASTSVATSGGSLAKWIDRLPHSADRRVTEVTRLEARPIGLLTHSTGESITIDWHRVPESIEWFPPSSDQFTIADIRIDTHDKTTKITFKAQPFAKTKITPATLDSVLAYTVDGRRKGLAIPLRVVGGQDASSETSKSNP